MAPQMHAKPILLPSGFTLIEILLALMVFALSFGLIMETLTTAGKNTRTAGELGEVALLAQNKLDQIGVTESIEPGQSQGRMGEQFRYQLSIVPYVASDSVAPATTAELFRVELAVSWGEGKSARTERFSTLRVRLKEGQF
jgi:general secretion pathway protein I